MKQQRKKQRLRKNSVGRQVAIAFEVFGIGRKAAEQVESGLQGSEVYS